MIIVNPITLINFIKKNYQSTTVSVRDDAVKLFVLPEMRSRMNPRMNHWGSMRLVKTYHWSLDCDLPSQRCTASHWKHVLALRFHTLVERQTVVTSEWTRGSTDSGMTQTDVAKADRGMKNCWCNCLVNTAALRLAAFWCLLGISLCEILALQITVHFTIITEFYRGTFFICTL